MRIREIAESQEHSGFWRIHTVFRREGWRDNRKHVYHVYCEEKLDLFRPRPRRNNSAAHRQAHPEVSSLDECWSIDFGADQLFDGRRFRALTAVDNYSWQCPLIHADQSIKEEFVVRQLERLDRIPKRIKVDNCSEFISKALDKWGPTRTMRPSIFTDLANRLTARSLNRSTEVFGMSA